MNGKWKSGQWEFDTKSLFSEETIPNDYFEPIGEKSSEQFIANDYIGMAQNLKRMRKQFVNEYNNPIVSLESIKFYRGLIEFEDYCLDQPYE